MPGLASIPPLALLVLTLISSSTSAAAPPPEAALPIAIDLAKVPVGAWAEYAVAGGAAGRTIRWSLVGRDAHGTTLEVSVPDGEVGGGKRSNVVQRMTVAPAGVGKAPTMRKAAIQLADADPVELSGKGPRLHHGFAAIDGKHKLGSEKIVVPAGTFSTTHHRRSTAAATLEYWVADGAPPLGIVKLVITPARGKKGQGGPVTVELVKVGTDARPQLVKTPKPLKAATLTAIRTDLRRAPGAAPTPTLTPRRLPAPKPVVPVKEKKK